jgi:hypothetical protein
LLDQGPPIYTRGPTQLYGGVDISGGLDISGGITVRTGGITAPINNIDATTGTISGQRLVLNNVVTLTQSTTTTLTADCSIGSVFTVVVNSGTDNFSIEASNVSAGQVVVFIINSTAAALTPQITFGNNIRENQVAGSLTVTSARQATVTFIGFSTYLLETSRVAVNAAG